MQYQPNNDYMPPEQLEYIVQKQVPYFEPQKQVEIIKTTPTPTYSTTYTSSAPTTVTPLIRVHSLHSPAPKYTKPIINSHIAYKEVNPKVS